MRILPDGYTQLEYIQSNGVQNIDTGVRATVNTKVQLLFGDIVHPSNGEYAIMGAAWSGTGFFLTYTSTTAGRWLNGGSANLSYKTGKNEIVVKQGSVTLNGVTTAVSNNSSYPANNIYLMATGDGTAGTTWKGRVKIYSCQIYDGNVIVRNYVPCKTPSGEVGLYDLANNVFYGNAGTGAFVAGPEFSYNEVEYIKSTGTQYVNTGVIVDGTTRLDLEFMPSTDGQQDNAMFGASWTNNGFLLTAYKGRLRFHSKGVYIDSDKLTEKNVISCSPTAFVVNGTTNKMTGTGTDTINYPIYLFWVGDESSPNNKGHYALYSCKIYRDATIIRDFVPVVGSDNVAGLWDKVEKVFYGNAGTGTFIAGAELLDEWSDIEYIESTGSQYIDTGFKHNQNTRVVMHVKPTTITANAWAFEGRAAQGSSISKGVFFFTSTNQWTVDYTTTRTGFNGIGITDELFIDYNKNVCTINGISITNSATTFQSTSNLVLLADNSGGYISGYLNAKLYSCQIYDDGKLVGDYVPCLTVDGRVGLRNALNNTFLPNKGSGAFIAGPIIPDVLPPLAPEKADAVYVDFANVLLLWSISETAEEYNVMRNGELIGATKNTFLFDNMLEKETAYTYQITARNEGGESEPVTVLAETTRFKLITDRTADDVQEAIQAINTGTLPDAWFAGLKGAYNAVDFNRVEAAVLFVIERLKTAGWYLAVQSKTDWTFADFPNAKEMQRYLDNVRLLRSALPVNMPAMPDTMRLLKYEEANTIEQILEMLDAAVTNIMLNVYFANEVYSGEV